MNKVEQDVVLALSAFLAILVVCGVQSLRAWWKEHSEWEEE